MSIFLNINSEGDFQENHLERTLMIDLVATAGEDIGGNRIVLIFNDIATYADKDSNYNGVLGMSLGASMLNDNINIRVSGFIDEPTWNLSPGYVFLGINGLITQIKPSSGTVIVVGIAVSETKIKLNFQQLYKRV